MDDSSTSPKKAKFADPGQVAARTRPGLTSADRLLLPVPTCQRETVAAMWQTCGVLCSAARLGRHRRMGANRINKVCGFDKQSASPPGGAGGVAGSASGFLVHPSQPVLGLLVSLTELELGCGSKTLGQEAGG